MNLALFDFDGTITTHDTLLKFIRYSVGDVRFVLGLALLSPTLLAYKLKLLPNYKAKEKMLAHFFQGMNENDFKHLAQTYSLEYIDTIVRPKAQERIAWHKNRGDKVVVVSASMECWLRPWCEREGLALIATKMQFENGKVTGKFQTKNCFGPEKATRVLKQFDLSVYDTVYAYGDSSGDKELLELADKGCGFYKLF